MLTQNESDFPNKSLKSISSLSMCLFFPSRKLLGNLRLMIRHCLILTTLLFAGCQSPHPSQGKPCYIVTKSDTNHDGQTDRVFYHAPGWADVDYELKDTNFDGRFDQRIDYGYTITYRVVDVPVN
jgi:hypothetical protein